MKKRAMHNVIKAAAAGMIAIGATTLSAQSVSNNVVITEQTAEALLAKPTAVAMPLSDNLTPQQRNALWGFDFNPLKPGVYRIRSKNSTNCVRMITRTEKLEQAYLALAFCNAYPNEWTEDAFVLIPHRAGGYTIRTYNAPASNQGMHQHGRIAECATIARGVVFGPARIDVRGCNFPDGVTDWVRVGQTDQQFLIYRAPGGGYEIKGRSNDEQNFECWAPRGGNTGDGTDIIRWPCTGGTDQQFTIEWVKEVGYEEGPTLNAMNWFRGADGYRRMVAADGVDLPQGNLTEFETIADNGAYCMQACFGNRECRAWTWTGQVGLKGKPYCQLKSQISVPVNKGPEMLGRIFSGVIRP